MTNNTLDSCDSIAGLVEIRDPEIDADAIRTRVSAALAARRAWAMARGLDYDALAGAAMNGTGEPSGHDALRAASAQLRTAPLHSAVALEVTPSRIPLLGGIARRLRALLHNVAVFYVNRSAARQETFNRAAATTLLELERAIDDTTEISRLREQIASLELEIRDIRQRLHDNGR